MEIDIEKQLLIFDNWDGSYDNKSTLQNNFQKFLNKRKELRKSSSISKNKIKSYRDCPERINLLRKKFIDRAISYLGIPYSKKYLSEGNPLFSSSIFLDCCGLVRQCVNDLSEDLGFMLGGGNQAYQFDTLPDIVSFNDIREGDLIFYEAIYYPEKRLKEQPHNIVHVEIFLGNKFYPERTIASRDKFGVVEYNDTYKFTSENYYDIKYHFRSIDPWLKGIHKSYCQDHKWDSNIFENDSNRYSVFRNIQSAEESLS